MSQILSPRLHTSEDIYASFLASRGITGESQRECLYRRKRFVAAYPDLELWFQTPLSERGSHVYAQTFRASCKNVSYRARSYLYYLALAGYATFDWDWIITLQSVQIWDILSQTPLFAQRQHLVEEAVRLGYNARNADRAMRHALSRLMLRTGITDAKDFTQAHFDEFEAALIAFEQRNDILAFFPSQEHYRNYVKYTASGVIRLCTTVFYHQGLLFNEPRRRSPLYADRSTRLASLSSVIKRYVQTRLLAGRPSTALHLEGHLYKFARWIEAHYPDVTSFAMVTRDHVLAYAADLDNQPEIVRGRTLGAQGRRNRMKALAIFFRDVTSWGWDDVPLHPLLAAGDLPKVPQRIPRYIPDEDRNRLLQEIRTLASPYQKAALLTAYWSGARQSEIRHLALDCLDYYPNGTPRLHIPVGKTYTERLVPIHEEAAEALQAVQKLHQGDRGFRDENTGVLTRYLFVEHGKLMSRYALFDQPLQMVCTALGLVDAQGRPTITSHRFRHSVGKRLAERGAKLRTIMKILGHASPNMSVIYTDISDQTVLSDYEMAISPGAEIAGPFAETLRAGTLAPEDVAWLEANYFKTELELGRCFRLPQEGPCECDLYLNCPKFVTTPEYAPRLRRRRRVELTLIDDALGRGWEREAERHRCTVKRIESLLAELGETIEGEEAET